MSRRPLEAGRPAPGRRTAPLWPVALAMAVRLIAWFLIPASRFASDEDSYYQVSTALLRDGHQDLFWPPLTGWLLAALRLALGTDAIGVLRLAWIAMDVGCLLAIWTLAARAGAAMWPADSERAARLATLASVAYALYLPAISHAQFATSEIPALLQVLGILVLLTGPGAGFGSFAAGGLLAGTLVLTRPSLLPLAVLLPATVALRRPVLLRHAAIFTVLAAVVVSAHVYRNWRAAGQLTISTNSAYNFYIGNRDLYAEDLNLFDPRATPAQIEFRRQQWSGELVYPSGSPAELQALAWAWIGEHPLQFARRAVGRLARVFVPKTDVLEMLGGEVAAGATAPRTLALLTVANAQWAVALFGGMLGLFHLRRRAPDLGWLFVATIAGSLVLCLVAISKPRYSFVVDPLLLIAAVLFAMAPRAAVASLGKVERRIATALAVFLLWSWVAFLIFAFTSRAAM